MEVFALDLAVRETGAAQVEQSLAAVRAEAGKTATAASTMGRQMGRTAAQMVVAGNIATGSTTNLTHAVGGLALSMGPGGILAVAVGGLVVFWKRAFDTMRADVKKAQLEIVSDTRRMFALMSAAARESDLKGVADALRDVRGGQAFVIGEQQLRLLPEQERRTALLERGLTRLREEYGRIQGVIAQAAEDERLWTESSENRTAERAARMREQRDVLKQLRPLATEYRVAIDTLARTEGVLLDAEKRLNAEAAVRLQRSNDEVRAAAERTAAIERERTAILNRERIRAIGPAGLPRGFENLPSKKPLFTPEQIAEATRLGELQDDLAMGIAGAITGGIVAGISQAIASGDIGAGFGALAGALLAGLGSAMVEFGTASVLAGGLMDTIKTALASFLPGGAVGAGLAMIAIGSALGGVAQRSFGGMGAARRGAGAGGRYTPFTPSAPPSEATRIVFGPTSAGLAAGLTPVVAPNITVIGPNDPTAQRAIEEILRNAQRRGTLR